MSKPLIRGLHYFPKDVGYFDDFKIIDLMSKYGPVGSCIYDSILMQIYKEGYYLELPIEKLALLAVRAIGSRWVTKEHAINVITYCGDIGLFRVDLLEQGIVTSAGIQRRYKKAKEDSRRKFQIEKYWVLDENGKEVEYPLLSASLKQNKCAETHDKCTKTIDNCTFKSTKEKQSKGNKNKVVDPDPGTVAVFQTFEDCGFCINAHATDRLLGMIDDYSAEWVEEAIKRATDRGKKNLAYIEGILRSWNSAGAMDDRRKEQYSEYSGNHGETGDAFDPFAGEEIL